MKMMVGEYHCAVCGEVNETLIDQTGGTQQEFIEDCCVCCRPNVLRVRYNASSEHYVIEASFEE
jgi:hypothetical protein